MVFDGYCDDDTNVEVCNWDGGDCCDDTSIKIKCSACECLEPSQWNDNTCDEYRGFICEKEGTTG